MGAMAVFRLRYGSSQAIVDRGRSINPLPMEGPVGLAAQLYLVGQMGQVGLVDPQIPVLVLVQALVLCCRCRSRNNNILALVGLVGLGAQLNLVGLVGQVVQGKLGKEWGTGLGKESGKELGKGSEKELGKESGKELGKESEMELGKESGKE